MLRIFLIKIWKKSIHLFDLFGNLMWRIVNMCVRGPRQARVAVQAGHLEGPSMMLKNMTVSYKNDHVFIYFYFFDSTNFMSLS